MTQFLFDIDTLIFLLKQHTGVASRVQAVGYQTLALSVITIAEVLHGAYFSANPASSLQITRGLIGHFRVLDLNGPIADKFGEMKAALRLQGLVIADFDLLIGATALIEGRTLVTNNTRHFQRLAAFGLVLENWTV